MLDRSVTHCLIGRGGGSECREKKTMRKAQQPIDANGWEMQITFTLM